MAPSYFQQMMASVVLLGLIYNICEVYLDDIIIYANGHQQFCERLEAVFQRLEEKNISLKAAKLKLGVKKVEYVGREISKDGITMSSKKIKGVTDFPMPRKTTELRSFLGLTNYFRDHVPNHSNVVAPLHKMIDHAAKKQTLLVWTDEAADAFTAIKELISKSPLLYFLDDTAPITLMTDASDYGIGGYLYQEVDGQKQLVALVSKSLTKPQLNWSVIQKEAFALYFCCTYLDHLLRDRRFTILTDHKNLTFLDKEKNQMVGRWRCALQELDYTIGYVQGKHNEVADAMSRLCKNRMPKKEIVAAIMMLKPLTTEKYVFLTACHNALVGHGGFKRTLLNLKKAKTIWEGMRHDIRAFLKSCPCCQKMLADKQKNTPHRFTTSNYGPMQCINIDFIGPFPDKGYILVLVDTFTRFAELSAQPDNTAKSACTALIEHVGRYGAPRFLRSDNGPHFANKVIEEFAKVAGSTQNKILPYSSQENAIVERMNKEVNRHITAYTFDRATTDNYKEILPFVQRILNSTVNERTKTTPAKLVYGNSIDLDANLILPRDEVNLNWDNVTYSTEKIMQMQDELIRITAELLKKSDDEHNASGSTDYTTFDIDSFVLVQHRNAPPTRMHTLWLGPMRVVSNVLDEYTLLDLVTNREKRYHLSQMKEFIFDPKRVNPTDIARRDYLEFFIEDILAMSGNTRAIGSLKFHVKWLNYPQESNTWEPWKHMRKAEKVHEFLIQKGLRKLIPSEFQANYR
jgi:transposase InsO family protein